MKPLYLFLGFLIGFLACLFIYDTELYKATKYDVILNENKHLKEQIRIANTRIDEINNHFLVNDYLKRSNDTAK